MKSKQIAVFMATCYSFLSLAVLVPVCVHATSIRVPADQSTIQAAVNVSADDDTILVAPGTYTGAGNRNVLTGARRFSLISEAGPQATIIDAQGTPADPARGVEIQNYSLVLIRGFTFQNGYIAGYQHGAGVKVHFAPATIQDCIFRDNTVEGVGGGVFANSGGGFPSTVVIRDCVFENNSALIGGAVQSYTRDIFIEDCVFRDNHAEQSGGGMSLANDGYVRRCTFDGNVVGGGGIGAAVSAESGDAALTFEECVFVRNSGGSAFSVYNGLEDQLTVANCTYYANEALLPEGATITISGAVGAAPISIENSIIAFSVVGSAIACVDAAVPSVSCTDIYGNAGGDWTDCVATQLGNLGNISLDPLFCDASADKLTIYQGSPCAPAQAGDCGLIGALGVACTPVSTKSTTFGALKAKYKSTDKKQ